MRWRVCVVLIATACAAPGGNPSDEPTDVSQQRREKEEQLPAARPAEPQAAQQADAQALERCDNLWWCANGDGSPGDARPPRPVAASPPDAKKAPKGAKNVLLIIVDDMRPQLNKAYGHDYMVTPNLDKLAESPGAVVFSRAYAQAAHCAPSRNSFMSGRYPDRLKVYNVFSDFTAASNAVDPIWPIPQYFKDNGYLSFGGGKIYHPNHPIHNHEPSWSQGTVKAGEFKYFNDPDHGCPDGTGGNPNVHGEGAHEGGCAGCPAQAGRGVLRRQAGQLDHHRAAPRPRGQAVRREEALLHRHRIPASAHTVERCAALRGHVQRHGRQAEAPLLAHGRTVVRLRVRRRRRRLRFQHPAAA